MTAYIIPYFATLVFFLVVDMIWLGGIAKIFYVLYILGVVIFAIRPAIVADSLMTGLMLGALYGFFCYMTYDLTNLATLKGWPEKLIWIDIPWGTVLTGTAALFGTWVAITLT